MKRVSTYREYRESGKLVVDAGGIHAELYGPPTVWTHHGTGTPTLAGFPGARVGDVIRRLSDGQEWRVDE